MTIGRRVGSKSPSRTWISMAQVPQASTLTAMSRRPGPGHPFVCCRRGVQRTPPAASTDTTASRMKGSTTLSRDERSICWDAGGPGDSRGDCRHPCMAPARAPESAAEPSRISSSQL